MSTKLPDGLAVEERMTEPSRPGKRPRPVWVVTGDTRGYEAALRECGGRPWRGNWSFWEDPTDDLAAAIAAGQPSFAEQQQEKRSRAEARAQRYAGYAANAAARSDAAREKSHQIADRIPFGQPVLVGHHSEARHRRDIARINKAMDTSVEEGRKARHWDERAKLNQTAAQPEDLAFCDRRLREAQAEVRAAQRGIIIANADPRRAAGLDGWRRDLDAATERVEYWQGKIAALGGVQYGKHNVQKGDLVLIRHGWAVVDRANPTTVTVTLHVGPIKYPYSDIRGRKRP